MRKNLRVIIVLELAAAFVLFVLAETNLSSILGVSAVIAPFQGLFRRFAEAILIAAILTITFESAVRAQLIEDLRQARDQITAQLMDDLRRANDALTEKIKGDLQAADAQLTERIRQDLQGARRQLTEQILRLIKHANQPEAVLAEVDEQVISKPLLRQKSDYEVSLAPLKGHPDLVTMTAKTKYTLQNLTAAKAPHRVGKLLSATCEDIIASSSKILEVSARKLPTSEQLISYSGPGNRVSDGKIVEFFSDINIEPHEIVEVEIWSEQVRDCNDTEVFVLLVPTLHTDISVHAPEDIVVEVHSFHPTQDAIPVRTPALLQKRWEIPAPLLPGQGFEVVWHRNAKTPRSFSEKEV